MCPCRFCLGEYESDYDESDDDEHDEKDGDEEAEISELIRKKFQTTTSQEKDCGGGHLKTAMLDAGIPYPFCRFVIDLLDNGHGQMFRSEYSFSSFKDVQSDLKKMISNPDGFLHGSNPDRWKLVFGDKLNGRDVEMEALTGATIAALVIYDMCKALSHDIRIGPIRLLVKRGGKCDHGPRRQVSRR